MHYDYMHYIYTSIVVRSIERKGWGRGCEFAPLFFVKLLLWPTKSKTKTLKCVSNLILTIESVFRIVFTFYWPTDKGKLITVTLYCNNKERLIMIKLKQYFYMTRCRCVYKQITTTGHVLKVLIGKPILLIRNHKNR